MILYASKSFTEHLKCKVSLPDKRVPQPPALESWSADILNVSGEGALIVVMNDASLSTIIIPMKGIRKFEDFFLSFVGYVTGFFELHGVPFDPFNQSVVVLARSDRSLIGTMNDAKSLIQRRIALDMDSHRAIDWNDLDLRLNNMPYSRIGNKSPNQMLKKLTG
jgi:hypothetical protein